MQKAAFLFWLLGISLLACDAGFENCLKKVQTMDVVSKGAVQIPLKKNVTLLYSNTPIQNALKSDPFLHLYLLRSDKKVSHPFKINKFLHNKELASIHNEIVCGKIVKKQQGLDHLAHFSKRIFVPSVILNGCCELVALGTPKGVIEKPYIEHFLKVGGVYGDLGVRIADLREGAVVASRNPFVDSSFQTGDKIISINGKSVKSAAELNRKILFSPVGSIMKVTIRRDSKEYTLNAKVFKRRGGGYISDTFFETVGIYVDEKLRVISSSNEKIHKGDRFVVVDSKWVSTQADIRKALSTLKSKEFLVGINRKGLDIFIKFKRD